MLQYVITGLAGLALGIVAMRVWQGLDKPSAAAVPPISDEQVQPSADAPAISSRKLLIGAGALVAAAAAVFAFRGSDQQGTQADGVQAAGSAQAGDPPLADVDTMIGKLAARLEKNPDDGEGQRMLGWSYLMTGHPDKAVEPFRKAVALLPKSAQAQAGLGEALSAVAGGKVTDEALNAFQKALSIDPTEPRARYFAALHQAQHGQQREALDKWIALANSGPADAPWQADVRRQIDSTAKQLGIDVSGKLKAGAPAAMALPAPAMGGGGALPPPDPAAVAAANQMAPADRQKMVDQMVEGLAAKLKANPDNPDGWVRLLRSRMVLQQTDQAGRDLVIARKALSGNAQGLALVNAAASELKVPGA